MEYENRKLKILFVCDDNYCRSPMAECILKDLVLKHKDLEWTIDSAALNSSQIGRLPNGRGLDILGRHGLKSEHVSRKITIEEFNNFDYIFGMDDMNIAELQQLAPSNCKAKIQLLGTYGCDNDKNILHPFTDHGLLGFIKNYDQISQYCENFIDTILNVNNIDCEIE